jgi:hypothetical protein
MGKMSKQKSLQTKAYAEIAKFQKTMDELSFLKTVSQDLKNYRKMIRLKKYD